jgi:lantibiotic protection ABC transporter MutE/EpiE family permease subunit
VNKTMRLFLSEMIKTKRTFTLHLLWIAPLIPLLCAYSGGMFSGLYFWYCAFLPGALTLMCALIMQKDKKMNYRALLSLPFAKSKLWLGKIASGSVLLLLANLVFFALIFFWGLIPPYHIYGYVPTLTLLAVTGLLFLSFLWQVPLCLFLSAKFGLFVTVLLNMVANIGGGAAFANLHIWAFPYAIPYCAVGPVLKILPNGLKPDAGSYFLNAGHILPEILTAVALFIVLTAVTTLWFQKQEAK